MKLCSDGVVVHYMSEQLVTMFRFGVSTSSISRVHSMRLVMKVVNSSGLQEKFGRYLADIAYSSLAHRDIKLLVFSIIPYPYDEVLNRYLWILKRSCFPI